MISKAFGFVVGFGCLMTSGSLQAHHSTAGVYDPGKEVKVTGALAKLQFVNPHGSIVVTVKNADGTTTDWTFTTGSATALASQGITKVGPNALKNTPVYIHLYVEDVDAVYARAVEAGAKPIMPVSDMFWGDRYGQIEDPFGHRWSIATHQRDLTRAEIEQAMKAEFAKYAAKG